MNLSKMHIHLKAPMHPSNCSLINNRQIQLGRQEAVNAALGGARINQSLNPLHSWNRGRDWHRSFESSIGIESNIN